MCLGDEQFACGIYRDIRDQAIRAAERWRDVQFRIQLSPKPAKDLNRFATGRSPSSAHPPPGCYVGGVPLCGVSSGGG